ncbi:hypothetical protein D3C87_111160 [compost metagenome]
MKHLILCLVLIFSFQTHAADCSSITEQILAGDDLKSAASKDLGLNGQELKAKRAKLVAKFVYSGKIFEMGDEVDHFVDAKRTFTSATQYTKGGTKLRVFEDKKEKAVRGYVLDKNKKQMILTMAPDCSFEEAIYIDEGSRCYFKARECADSKPYTGAKFKEKCSYIQDVSEKALSVVNRACDIMGFSAKESGAPQTTSPSQDKSKSNVR